MALRLRHPEIAATPCSECQTWQYELRDGKWEIAERPKGNRLKRIGKTPCRTCPKKSPQEAHLYELSPKNERAVEFYYTTRAMRGVNLTDAQKQDAILQQNMGIIERIIQAYEQEQQAAGAVSSVSSALSALGGK